MAQNETYQTKVYQENGAERYVVNSGGTIAIESGGSIAIYSGAQFTIESTAVNLELAGADLAGDDLRRILISEQLMNSNQFSAGVNTLAVSNLPKNEKVHVIWASAAAGANDASFWMTSVSAGREVFLLLAGDSTGTFTNAVTTVDVSMSGCICLGSVGTAISRFTMNASGASDVLIHFIAPYDDVWAVVKSRGDVNEINNV